MELGPIVRVDNTRCIFATNFSGDPNRDRYKSDKRTANLILPNEEQALMLKDAGFNVKQTKPREDSDFEPVYYVKVRANYEGRTPPMIYLVCGDAEPRKLEEDEVGIIDDIRVSNVNVTLNPWSRDDKYSLYIRTMYVEQEMDYDPFAEKYANRTMYVEPLQSVQATSSRKR